MIKYSQSDLFARFKSTSEKFLNGQNTWVYPPRAMHNTHDKKPLEVTCFVDKNVDDVNLYPEEPEVDPFDNFFDTGFGFDR